MYRVGTTTSWRGIRNSSATSTLNFAFILVDCGHRTSYSSTSIKIFLSLLCHASHCR